MAGLDRRREEWNPQEANGRSVIAVRLKGPGWFVWKPLSREPAGNVRRVIAYDDLRPRALYSG